MKGRNMAKWLAGWMVGCWLLLPVPADAQLLFAEECGRGKSLSQLTEWVAGPGTRYLPFAFAKEKTFAAIPVEPAHPTVEKSPFVPVAGLQWTAGNLPFFCRIEHNLGKKTRVPFKFRLGTVEYVDFLEGK